MLFGTANQLEDQIIGGEQMLPHFLDTNIAGYIAGIEILIGTVALLSSSLLWPPYTSTEIIV